MNKTLTDWVGEALHAAREHDEADGAVLAFVEELEASYSGDMEIEHALSWLADAVRASG